MLHIELSLVALLLVVLYIRPRIATNGLGKLGLIAAVLIITRYTNRNSAILASIIAIALIHISHSDVEGMDAMVVDLSDNNMDEDESTQPQDEATDKCKDKLSKMDLECISRALRSCSANELPIDRDAAGATDQPPTGVISTVGKGTEGFYS